MKLQKSEQEHEFGFVMKNFRELMPFDSNICALLDDFEFEFLILNV